MDNKNTLRIDQRSEIAAAAEQRLQAVYGTFKDAVSQHQYNKFRQEAAQNYSEFFQPIYEQISNINIPGTDYEDGALTPISSSRVYKTKRGSEVMLDAVIRQLKTGTAINTSENIGIQDLDRILAGNKIFSDRIISTIAETKIGRNLSTNVASAIIESLCNAPSNRLGEGEKKKKNESLWSEQTQDQATVIVLTQEERTSLRTALEAFFSRHPNILKDIYSFFGSDFQEGSISVSDLIHTDDLEALLYALQKGNLEIPPTKGLQSLRNQLRWRFLGKGSPSQRGLTSAMQKLSRANNSTDLLDSLKRQPIDIGEIEQKRRLSTNPRINDPELQQVAYAFGLSNAVHLLKEMSDRVAYYKDELTKKPDALDLDNARVIQHCVEFKMQLNEIFKELEKKLKIEREVEEARLGHDIISLRVGPNYLLAAKGEIEKVLAELVVAPVGDISVVMKKLQTIIDQTIELWAGLNIAHSEDVETYLPEFTSLLQEKASQLKKLDAYKALLTVGEEIAAESVKREQLTQELMRRLLQERNVSPQNMSAEKLAQEIRLLLSNGGEGNIKTAIKKLQLGPTNGPMSLEDLVGANGDNADTTRNQTTAATTSAQS
jgi:hypothetical protein